MMRKFANCSIYRNNQTIQNRIACAIGMLLIAFPVVSDSSTQAIAALYAQNAYNALVLSDFVTARQNAKVSLAFDPDNSLSRYVDIATADFEISVTDRLRVLDDIIKTSSTGELSVARFMIEAGELSYRIGLYDSAIRYLDSVQGEMAKTESYLILRVRTLRRLDRPEELPVLLEGLRTAAADSDAALMLLAQFDSDISTMAAFLRSPFELPDRGEIDDAISKGVFESYDLSWAVLSKIQNRRLILYYLSRAYVYGGLCFLDANQDGFYDRTVEYEQGRISRYTSDADQDGLLDVEALFDDEKPAAAVFQLGPVEISVRYGAFPRVSSVKYVGLYDFDVFLEFTTENISFDTYHPGRFPIFDPPEFALPKELGFTSFVRSADVIRLSSDRGDVVITRSAPDGFSASSFSANEDTRRIIRIENGEPRRIEMYVEHADRPYVMEKMIDFVVTDRTIYGTDVTITDEIPTKTRTWTFDSGETIRRRLTDTSDYDRWEIGQMIEIGLFEEEIK